MACDSNTNFYSSYRQDQGHRAFRRDLTRSYRWYFRKWLPQNRSARILEVGCGEGDILCALRNQGYENLEGFDLREDAVATACERGVNAIQADARTFFLTADAKWDLILIIDVIEHLSVADVVTLLSAANQRLLPGGALLIQCPNVAGIFGATVQYGDVTHLTAFAPSSLSQICRRAGFRQIEIREAGPGCWGVLSTVQYAAWQVVRLVFRVLSMIETGGGGHCVFTRVMMARVAVQL